MDPLSIGVGLTALFLLYESATHDKKLSSNKSPQSFNSVRSKQVSFGNEGPKVLSGPMSETSLYVPSPKEPLSETSDIVPRNQSGGYHHKKQKNYISMAF